MTKNKDDIGLVLHEAYQGYATVTHYLQLLSNDLESGNVKRLRSTIKNIKAITTRELKQLERLIG